MFCELVLDDEIHCVLIRLKKYSHKVCVGKSSAIVIKYLSITKIDILQKRKKGARNYTATSVDSPSGIAEFLSTSVDTTRSEQSKLSDAKDEMRKFSAAS